MKEWKKVLGQESERYYDFLLALILLTGLTGFVLNQSLLFIPTALLTAVWLLSKAYDRFGGTQLSLKNEKRSVRLFPGEKTELTFWMSNGSRAPVLNGQLSFKSDEMVKGHESFTREAQKGYQYQLPLSLIEKGDSGVTVPITAEKRGVTKFSEMKFKYPHLIKFQPVHLDYQFNYETEVIVYPEQKPVYGIDDVFHLSIGEQTATVSPYEDLLTPIGTRDYVSSDPFHRIHWKASAKTQELQTKVYERQVDRSWTILVNTSQRTRLGNQYPSEHFEDLMSYASYICHEASKRSYTFDMALNMRRPHHRPFFYQPEGQGAQQLKQSLELLARMMKDRLIMPMEELMYRIDKSMYKRRTVLLLGEVPPSCERYITKWQTQGISVFILDVEQEQPILVRAGKRGNIA
ncbi:DUF58 domain-containing protein [Halobacillus litoralis]|uniref:DUF58 domain-containing protein n=1 Tax=Halobacillus litoralis TaxID=45668 RepID=UPI001CD6C718|nr:DUF58 domain-containing protein [Halobacillus litoralis]MCA0971718.1 DUF58 domain-containing protein [Halobacillus litoralis]